MKILVIAPAGLHLGYLGCYGNLWIDTGCLDALAAESAVFDQHISDCPCARGARRAWRTGRYDFSLSADKLAAGPEASADILSMLRTRRASSLLITDSPSADQVHDNNGWQKIHSIKAEKTTASYWGELRQLASESIRQLKSSGLVWIETSFLIPPWFINGSSPGYFSSDSDESEGESIEPLLKPKIGLVDSSDETTVARLQRTYAAAVSQLDRELGELSEELRSHDLYDSLMIIVTTDRGFPLGEHGLIGDSRPWLHEELVHTPLIIRMAHEVASGARISGLTQPVDLMPTLLEAFDFDLTSAGCRGSSLLPLIHSQQERIRDFACSGLQVGDEREYSLRTADWAFLLPQHTNSGDLGPPLRDRQLYVKPDDRWEVNNVLQHDLEFAEQLEHRLLALMNATSGQAHGMPSVGFQTVNPNTGE
jgi:hypothetical protein